MEETNRQLAALVAEIAATEPNAITGTTTEGGFQTKEDLFRALARNMTRYTTASCEILDRLWADILSGGMRLA